MGVRPAEGSEFDLTKPWTKPLVEPCFSTNDGSAVKRLAPLIDLLLVISCVMLEDPPPLLRLCEKRSRSLEMAPPELDGPD